MKESKKVRKWRRGQVWLLWRFRYFVKLQEEARAAKNKQQEARFGRKRMQIWSSIQKHEKEYGIVLGLKPERIDEFSRLVYKKIEQGRNPDQIIEETSHYSLKLERRPQ